MDTRQLLLTFIVFTHSLMAAMWWVAGSWMGLSRRASRQWMLAALANGAALTVTTLGTASPSPTHDLSRVVIAGSLVVWGAVSMRRGLGFFLKLSQSNREHLALAVAVVAFNVIVCWPLEWTATAMAASSLAMGWILGRTAHEAYEPLKIEFNRATAWTNAVLAMLAVAVFVAATLSELQPGTFAQWLDMPADDRLVVTVLCSVVLSILSAFVLGYVVVMRLVRRLEHLSHHDALTGLLNRRAIEYLLDREDQRLQRFGDPYSVLLIDIDHFKRINDRLGHAAGDAVLCAVARTLQIKAREVDRVARYGGEEFCVLLPHTLHEGALQAAERLREAVAQTSIPWNDELISVSISTGLACAAEAGESLQSLLTRTDEALYQAKGEGRNRVVASTASSRRNRQA
jgi:diguanylate cyclase (GGDEF)-like protein